MITISLYNPVADNPNGEFLNFITIGGGNSVGSYQVPNFEPQLKVFDTPDKSLGASFIHDGIRVAGYEFSITLSNTSVAKPAYNFLYNLGLIGGKRMILLHDGQAYDGFIIKPSLNTQNPSFAFSILNDLNRPASPVFDVSLFFGLELKLMVDNNQFDLISKNFESMLINFGDRALYGYYNCGIREINIYQGVIPTSIPEVFDRDADLLLSINDLNDPQTWVGTAIRTGTATWIAVKSYLNFNCGNAFEDVAIGGVGLVDIDGANVTSITDGVQYSQTAWGLQVSPSDTDSTVVVSNSASTIFLNAYKSIFNASIFNIYAGTIPASLNDIAGRQSDLLCSIEVGGSGEVTKSGAAGWLAILSSDETPLLMASYSQGAFDLSEGDLKSGQTVKIANMTTSVAESVDSNTELSSYVANLARTQ